MPENNNKTYISRQISVYKTDRKLVEFLDKLNPAPVDSYAHIHAHADDDGNGKRIYSNIGVVLQDYSGETIRVTANISPDEAQYIFNSVQSGVENFEFKAEKIFGLPDEHGYSQVTKLRIVRASAGSDGTRRNYPWCVDLENGRGIASKGKTGGTYCQQNSYRSDKRMYINLNDFDFFKLTNRVSQYINAWEQLYGASVMVKGRTALDEMSRKADIT